MTIYHRSEVSSSISSTDCYAHVDTHQELGIDLPYACDHRKEMAYNTDKSWFCYVGYCMRTVTSPYCASPPSNCTPFPDLFRSGSAELPPVLTSVLQLLNRRWKLAVRVAVSGTYCCKTKSLCCKLEAVRADWHCLHFLFRVNLVVES